jgi:hypothetical protein
MNFADRQKAINPSNPMVTMRHLSSNVGETNEMDQLRMFHNESLQKQSSPEKAGESPFAVPYTSHNSP